MQSLLSIKDLFLSEFSAHLDKKIRISNANRKLQQWACYTLQSPSKRIRPLMTYFASNCNKKSFDIALAIELIHTYSLIHDDLPSMDDDALRRGVESLHIHANEAAAILTGDMLLTLAFEVISTSSDLKEYEKIKIITLLAKASGGSGLIEGQTLDLFETQTTQKSLITLYAKKTSSLFIAALEAGSSICNQSREEQTLLKNIGLHFGIVFQLLDDLKDKSKNIKALNKSEIKDLYLKHKKIVFRLLNQLSNQNLFDLCHKILNS